MSTSRASLLLCVVLVACQKTSPAPAAEPPIHSLAPQVAPAPVPLIESDLLLWTVEKDGVRNHLFGTCHLPIPLDYALPSAQRGALNNARVVITEVDASNLNAIEIMGTIRDPGFSMSQALGPEAWRALMFRTRPSLPAPLIEHIPPWMMVVMLDIKPSDSSTGSFLDADIQSSATTSGASSLALETIDQQLKMMSGFNDDSIVQLKALALGGNTPEREAETDAVLDACLRSDSSSFEALMNDATYANSMGELLEVRNNNWMPTLEVQFAQGDAFVAVGTGHLFGASGLVRQFEDRGYTVTRQRGERTAESPWQPTSSKTETAPVGPVDEAALKHWSFVFTELMTTNVCGEMNPIRACLSPTEAACEARLQITAPMCVAQWADQLPSGDALVSEAVNAQIAGCVTADLLITAVTGPGISEAPECDGIRGAMGL